MDLSCIAVVAIAAIFLCLAVYPFLIYPPSLRLIRHFARKPLQLDVPQKSDPEERELQYSICMCAYNEDSVIREKMSNLLELTERLGSAEILVFVDGSTDRTSALLYEFRDRATI